MYILRALVFLFLAQAALAEQPTPILPDPKPTPGDTFDVTNSSFNDINPRLPLE